MRQSASAEAEVKRVEDDITALNLQHHQQVAEASHKYFVEVTKTCAAKWSDISEPSLTDDESERLAVLKHRFNLVISADYQVSKLVPYWGMSAQPRSTYYLQLSHDVLGNVNDATNKSSVYLLMKG